MRKLFLAILLLGAYFVTKAQQDAQYTQFMFNKLTLNPAYAGSAGFPCISCLHRSQWVGFDGAPLSQSVNFHMPFLSNRVGFGVSLNHDRIGPTDSWRGSLVYAYRMQLNKKNNISFGFNGTMRSYTVAYDEITAIHSGDREVPMMSETKYLPNVGVGLYYESTNYYIGVSVPSILQGNLEFEDDGNSDLSTEAMHAYLMAGVVIPFSKTVKLKPAILIKYVTDAPFDMDINASFIFFDRFWTGLSYRMGGVNNSFGESLSLIMMYEFKKAFKIGLAYDFSLSNIRREHSGTYEVTLGYCFKPNDEGLTNPRFF